MAKRKAPQVISGVSEHREKFVKLLNDFNAYGYSRFNVWNDFLHLAAISIANSCDPYNLANAPETVEEREKQYTRIIGKYKPELHNHFGEMLAEIVLELESYGAGHFTDVLGEIYETLDFSDEWTGQFFTTQCVSDLCGIMSANGNVTNAAIAERGFVTVNEPSCGGGSMVLGMANGLSKCGLNPQKQMLTVANDIDERCVHMSYIQLSLYGLPAIVLRQNTLTQEIYDAAWFTPMFILDGWTIKYRRAFKHKEPEVKLVEPIEQPVIAEPVEPPLGQLSLF